MAIVAPPVLVEVPDFTHHRLMVRDFGLVTHASITMEQGPSLHLIRKGDFWETSVCKSHYGIEQCGVDWMESPAISRACTWT